MLWVCLILAGLTLIVEGQLSAVDFEPAALVTTFVTVFTVAKVRYDMARKKQAKTPGPGIFLDDPELEELIKTLPY